MLIQQILADKANQGVLTIAPDSKVEEAGAILSAKGIGALVVSDDGEHAKGIITERDIVRELGKRGPGSLQDAVEVIMTRKLVTCGPGDRALRVLQLMTEGHFRHMPVLEAGKMVGLVSIGDVVKGRLKELSEQNEALKSMIMGY